MSEGVPKKTSRPPLSSRIAFVKHLEKFRARLVDRDDDDLVVRHAANDFDDVLGILRGKAGSRFVEKVNIRHADHIETDVEPFALAAAQRLLHRAAHDRVPALAQAKFDQLRFQTPHPVAPRKMRRTNRGRELQDFSPIVRCSSNASSCGT